MSIKHLLAALPCFALVFAVPMDAQGRGAAKIYREQFVQLHERTKAALARAEQQVKNGSSPEDRSELRREGIALTTLVHRLSEESGRSYVEDSKRVENPNKDLLFIESGCEQLSFVLDALDSFLATEDKAFLSFAKRGNELASSIEELL